MRAQDPHLIWLWPATKEKSDPLGMSRSLKRVRREIIVGMTAGTIQEALFDARWLVQSPYVSDDLKSGCWREPRAKAIARRYVQVNSPGLVWCVVVDVDHDDADWSADRADLPEPSWTAVNPFNGHAHIAYVLEVPVARSDAARTHPLRFLAHVEAGLIDALGGDLAYAGLLTKNPVHQSWVTRWCSEDGVYTLGELATALGDRLPKQLPRKIERSHGLGRNCTLFSELRVWAYTAIRRHREDGRDAWEEMTLGLGHEHQQPLPRAARGPRSPRHRPQRRQVGLAELLRRPVPQDPAAPCAQATQGNRRCHRRNQGGQLMTAMYPQRRKHTAAAMAEKFGISPRTVKRIMAQPRAEYDAEAHARQDEALHLRESGLKWREVGDALGGISESAAYQLAAKARARRGETVNA